MNDTMVPGLWLAGDILLGIAAVVSWLFVLMYRRVDWRASAIGKFLMRFVGISAVIFTYAVLTSHFEIPRLAHALIRLMLFLGLVVELSLLNAILISYEKKSKDGTRKDKESHHG